MKRQLRIFLCGTFSDLAAERRSVLKAIADLKLAPDCMELFGARNRAPLETCLDEVRQSDALIVIVGHQYGTLVPSGGTSFSEAEYEEGFRLGRECLVYLRDENVPVLLRDVEQDPAKLRLLNDFKSKLSSRHTPAHFTDAKDLALQVSSDLKRLIDSLEEAAASAAENDGANAPILPEIDEIVQGALAQGVSAIDLVSAIRKAALSLARSAAKAQPLVFLSYSPVDKAIVSAIANALHDKGLEVWLDESNLRAGSNYSREIRTSLETSDFIVFFMSKASLSSSNTLSELNAITARRLTDPIHPGMLPVLLEDVAIPASLRAVRYVDLRNGDVARAANEVLAAVRASMVA